MCSGLIPSRSLQITVVPFLFRLGLAIKKPGSNPCLKSAAALNHVNSISPPTLRLRHAANDQLRWISSHTEQHHVWLNPQPSWHWADSSSTQGAERGCLSGTHPVPLKKSVWGCQGRRGEISGLWHVSCLFQDAICTHTHFLLWVCVSSVQTMRLSYPDGCHCVAWPWRTPGCRRWRCVAGEAEASWRNRCTGAGRNACCGRWGGGRSSWRALKRNKHCQNFVFSWNPQELLS